LFTWAFFIAAGFAFLDWASTWKGWKIRLYVAKPATMIFLILWTFQVTAWQGHMLWFGLALVFSLIGDVALMLNPRYFMAGVGAFFLAHAAYLIGFNQTPIPFTLGVILSAGLVIIAAIRVFQLIKPGVIKIPRGKRFLAAVTAYGATLSLMLFSALITLFKADWSLLAGVLAAIGGTLFFTSDTILAYDRFVRKLKHGQSYVHLTYHLAQGCIVSGAILHFLRNFI